LPIITLLDVAPRLGLESFDRDKPT